MLFYAGPLNVPLRFARIEPSGSSTLPGWVHPHPYLLVPSSLSLSPPPLSLSHATDLLSRCWCWCGMPCAVLALGPARARSDIGSILRMCCASQASSAVVAIACRPTPPHIVPVTSLPGAGTAPAGLPGAVSFTQAVTPRTGTNPTQLAADSRVLRPQCCESLSGILPPGTPGQQKLAGICMKVAGNTLSEKVREEGARGPFQAHLGRVGRARWGVIFR